MKAIQIGYNLNQARHTGEPIACFLPDLKPFFP